MNPIELVRSRWLDTDQVLFCVYIDRGEVLVNENAKIERGEYAAIFFEKAWSIKDLLYGQKDNFFLRGQRRKSRAGIPRSQSERRIRFIFPARGYSRIISLIFDNQS